MAVIGVVAVLGGCAVDPIDLANRQCDADHPCAAEYTCVDGLCERTDSLGDGGDDGTSG